MSRFSVRGGWFVLLVSIGFVFALGAGLARATEQALTGVTTPWEQKQYLTLGVFNYLGDEATLAQYTPIVEYLNQKLTHEHIRLEVLSQAQIDARLNAGTLDFITTNPTHYLKLRQSDKVTGVLASLIESHQGHPAPCIAGVMFTRADRHDLQKLADMRGMIVAAPSIDNFGAFRTQQYELLRAGVRLPQDVKAVRELKTQEAVVQAVLQRTADVGFVRAGTLEDMEASGQIPSAVLRILNAKTHPRCLYAHSTPTYPGWPWLALSQVPERTVGRVAAALFALESNDPAALWAGIYGYSVPMDYVRVENLSRALRLPPFDHAPAFTVWDVVWRWKELLMALVCAAGVILVLSIRLVVAWRREQQARQFNQLVLTSLAQGVYQVDVQGVCHFINPSALKILRIQANEIIGHRAHALFHHHHADGRVYDPEDCPTRKTLNDAQLRRSEECFTRPDGEHFPVDMLVAPMLDNKTIVGAVVIFEDISERKRMEAQLRELATTDALTGLHNRRYFLGRLTEGIARIKRFAERTCVIMLDCDHFKNVNDRYGHAVGDEVLQGLADILRQNMRQTDSNRCCGAHWRRGVRRFTQRCQS